MAAALWWLRRRGGGGGGRELAEVRVNGVPVAALAPIVVLAVAWVAWCWWDIARGPVRHLPKWAWALVCTASVPLGGIVYLMVGRDAR